MSGTSCKLHHLISSCRTRYRSRQWKCSVLSPLRLNLLSTCTRPVKCLASAAQSSPALPAFLKTTQSQWVINIVMYPPPNKNEWEKCCMLLIKKISMYSLKKMLFHIKKMQSQVLRCLDSLFMKKDGDTWLKLIKWTAFDLHCLAFQKRQRTLTPYKKRIQYKVVEKSSCIKSTPNSKKSWYI